MEDRNRAARIAVGGAVCAVLFSLPWCCILPALFSLLGLVGVGAAVRGTAITVMPYLLALSIFSLGRAHYLVHVRRQGNRPSRIIVWVSTGIVAGIIMILVVGKG